MTERTFFRHFPDKREALFDGEEAFRDALTDAVVAAPKEMATLDVLFAAFITVQPMLERNRAFSEPRQALIARTPALQERVLTKTAGVTRALSAALERRGVEGAFASLSAQVGMAAFSYAARAWFDDPKTDLEAHLRCAFQELHNLTPPISPRQ